MHLIKRMQSVFCVHQKHMAKSATDAVQLTRATVMS